MEQKNNVITLYPSPLHCDEVTELLSDYVDAELEPARRVQYERHLAGCDRCRSLVDDCKRLVQIARTLGAAQMPHEVRERLHQRLQNECCRELPGRIPGFFLIKGEKREQ